MYKQIVFVLLITTILAINQSGFRNKYVPKEESQQVKYQRALQMVRDNYASSCPGASGYSWVSGGAVESQMVSGMNYIFDIKVKKENDVRNYRVSVSVPATKSGRGSINSCQQVFG